MARIESISKGGFYPTPSEEMTYLLKRLRSDNGDHVSIIDPCCGKGDALIQWKNSLLEQGTDVSDFGIEIEKSRAGEAEEKISAVAKCGYEEMKMSRKAFSAMYLNPPFMYGDEERTELTFLRDLSKNYIMDNGVLIFNIPQHVLYDVAKILSIRFRDIRVYRFSDDNYDMYHQVIVYAIKRKPGMRTKDERQYQQEIYEQLLDYASKQEEALPPLDQEDWDATYYVIPPSGEVETFESRRIEPEDIFKSIRNPNNGMMKKVAESVNAPDPDRQDIVYPAMPLRTTHMATAIASGSLPEEMGDHLLVGISKQVQNQTTNTDENGHQINRETTSTKSVVRIFSEDGVFNLQE